MISAFRRLFDTRRPRLAMRAKVNLVGSFGVLERTDGVVEAIERKGTQYCLAVQWHPEELTNTPEPWDRNLFSAFARAVAGR